MPNSCADALQSFRANLCSINLPKTGVVPQIVGQRQDCTQRRVACSTDEYLTRRNTSVQQGTMQGLLLVGRVRRLRELQIGEYCCRSPSRHVNAQLTMQSQHRLNVRDVDISPLA